MKIYNNAAFPKTSGKGMQYLDNISGENVFVASENFSIADITLLMGPRFADFAKTRIPKQYQNLSKYRNTVTTQPYVLASGD